MSTSFLKLENKPVETNQPRENREQKHASHGERREADRFIFMKKPIKSVLRGTRHL